MRSDSYEPASQPSNLLLLTDSRAASLPLHTRPGQSNMNKPLAYVFNASAEIAAATHKNIRLFSVPGSGVPNCGGSGGGGGAECGPQTNWTAQQCATNPHTGQQHCSWLPLSPKTVKDFSAVCYLTVTEMMRIQPKLATSTIFGATESSGPRFLVDCCLTLVPSLSW